MVFKTSLASPFAILALSCSAAFAQEAIELKDENANYTMQLGGGIAWSVEVDKTGLQSTVVAASAEEFDPFTLVSAMTYLQVNPMVKLGEAVKQKTTDQFLLGLCENYQCVDVSARSYEDIDGRKAWIATTMLDLPAYIDMGVPEAVLIATTSPEGYMQLFSLHTAEGKADEMKAVLIDAIKTIKPAE